MEISINNVREARNELKHNFDKGARYLCRKYLEKYDLSKNLEEVVRGGRSFLRFTDVMLDNNASMDLKHVWIKEAHNYFQEKGCVASSDLTEFVRRQLVRLRKSWTADEPFIEFYLEGEV